MSVLDDATIIYVPGVYKTSAVALQKPISAGSVSSLTFARASTATRVNSAGLIESVATNVPRVDYLNGSCGAQLLEPARTNLLTYSEQFDNVAWIKTAITTTANDIVSPDGATTADKLETNGDGARFAGQNVLLTNATVYQATCYLQNGNTGWGAIAVFDGVSDIAVGTFNLATGVVGSTSLSSGSVAPSISIEDAGNGWYRCILQFTSTSTGIWNFRVYSSAQGITDVSGVIGEFTYAWGAQLEVGAYPTSYIKTEALTVTRSAETLSQTGLASLLGDSEGTIFFEGSVFDSEGNINNISLSDGTNNNRINLRIYTSSAQMVIVAGGVSQAASGGGTIDNGEIVKIAIKYAANDFALWLNGVEILTDNSGSTFGDGVLTRLAFDSGAGSFNVYGNVKALAVWDRALTDTELENLTT